MLVTVKLYNELKCYAQGRGNEFVMEHSSGATVQAILDDLGITEKVRRTIIIDGILGKETSPLSDGCTVVMFPPVSGG